MQRYQVADFQLFFILTEMTLQSVGLIVFTEAALFCLRCLLSLSQNTAQHYTCSLTGHVSVLWKCVICSLAYTCAVHITGSPLAAASVATDSYQVVIWLTHAWRDWLTDQTTDCCFIVIGCQDILEFFALQQKIDPVGRPSLLAAIGVYIFLPSRDWPVQHPEEYLYYTSIVFHGLRACGIWYDTSLLPVITLVSVCLSVSLCLPMSVCVCV